jgi:transposase
MKGNGYTVSEQEVRRIIHLLSSTGLSIGDIAKRMGLSNSVIVAINRRFSVRDVQGRKSSGPR